MPTSTSAGELEWGAGGGSGTTYTFTSNTSQTGKGQFTVTPASGTAQTVTTLYGTVGTANRPTYLSSGTITQCDTPTSSDWNKGVPYVQSNGVMDISYILGLHRNDSTNRT